ncbi:hypothetical protein BP6252_01653 [Coleophoma cylindrospora]|uniref:Uncharacterized protein n=1 Tax=Coleophoma cylindrospora TaxID=1849047 RepID=A0A3D8STW9_9HELO|nr:hypothetical protein BP6252_01653 [Coleophoma cylindrospora]
MKTMGGGGGGTEDGEGESEDDGEGEGEDEGAQRPRWLQSGREDREGTGTTTGWLSLLGVGDAVAVGKSYSRVLELALTALNGPHVSDAARARDVDHISTSTVPG